MKSIGIAIEIRELSGIWRNMSMAVRKRGILAVSPRFCLLFRSIIVARERAVSERFR